MTLANVAQGHSAEDRDLVVPEIRYTTASVV